MRYEKVGMTSLYFLALFLLIVDISSSRVARKIKKRRLEKSDSVKHYDFIFGWSTGHVGTTSFSEAKLYGDPQGITFLHETHYGLFKIGDEDNLNKEKWLTYNYDKEYEYVKNIYMPFMIRSRGDNKTLVDLGHNNMLFIKPLLKYILEETSFRVLFVRIRRERLEAALSLSYRRPGIEYEYICDGLKYRYCPYDREEDVLLHPPSKNVWENLTIFQKGLWMVDECEARWNQMLQQHPNIERLEILWGKMWPGSFDVAANEISEKIGVNHNVTFDPEWKIVHKHAGALQDEVIATTAYALEDRRYRKAMGYSYIAG